MSYNLADDNQLVLDYLNGNEAALSELVQRHKKKIYSYIFMIVKNKELTEDIFQDTFFKVINSLKLGQYYEDGKFLAWALRIAHNLVIDHYRRIKKMPTVPNIINDDGEEIDIFSLLNIPQQNNYSIEKTEFKKDIRTLIEELSDEQKEVVMMRVYYDMSFKEIADLTQVSVNTSLGRMRYALINLKKKFEEKNIEIPV